MMGPEKRRAHEARLFQDAREPGDRGRRARALLAEKHRGLVRQVAARYIGKGLPFEDLIQEGNLGLMRAIEEFDPDRGFAFSTYAVGWIRKRCGSAVDDKGRTVRLPSHGRARLSKILAARDLLSSGLGRQPSYAEISLHLADPSLGPATVRAYLRAGPEPESLDAPRGPAGTGPVLGALVADEGDAAEGADPEAAAIAAAMRGDVRRLLPSLTGPERLVVALYYGLDGGEPKTLREVGRELGVSGSRAGQVHQDALVNLRCALLSGRGAAKHVAAVPSGPAAVTGLGTGSTPPTGDAEQEADPGDDETQDEWERSATA